MKGYWGDEKKTKEVMIPDEDGRIWMHVSLLLFIRPRQKSSDH